MNRVQVAGFKFECLNFDDAVNRIIEISKSEMQPAPFVVTPNVDHVLRLEKSRELREIYEKAVLILADGMPLVWLSRLQRQRLPERVTGADLLPAICERAAGQGIGVFLLGGPPGAAKSAADSLKKKHPDLGVGEYCPPLGFEFDEVENQRIINLINEQAPGVLFVGVGSPKQEMWIARFRSQLNVGICLGVGAAIEFQAGLLKRAPVWMQRSGTEWIYRMLSDPRRLVKRYASNAAFLLVVGREILGKQKKY